MSFASVLDSYCNALGCTNKEIAERCGMAPSTLSRYRSGERAPEMGSDAVERLVAGIVELSCEHGIDGIWREDIVRSALEGSLPGSKMLGMSYGARVSALMTLINMRNSEIAVILGLSPSYMSRIRSDERAPSGNRELAEKFAYVVAQRSIERGKRSQLIDLIDSNQDARLGTDGELKGQQLVEAIVAWLQGHSIVEADVAALEGLFEKIDNYYFDDVLSRIEKLDPIASADGRPEERVRLYSGLEGMSKAEVEFFEIAAAYDAREVYLNNDMPLLETTLTPEFANVYRRLIGSLVCKGTRLVVVHTIDRPPTETLIILELWLPLFLYNHAESYYLKDANSRVFFHENFVSDVCALSAEAVMGHRADGRCILSTAAEDIAYYQQKMDFIMERASSLLEVYRDDDPEQRERFEELQAARKRAGNGREVCAQKYRNLHVDIYPDNCAILTIAHDPTIHLVIRHPQLCYIISYMR